MSLFKSHTLTVKRPIQTVETGRRIRGRWVPGTIDTDDAPNFTIRTSVQPAKGKELEVLPEGLRTGEIYKIYPETELKAVDQHSEQEADIVVYNNADYKVQHLEIWQNGLVDHYKAFIVRVKE